MAQNILLLNDRMATHTDTALTEAASPIPETALPSIMINGTAASADMTTIATGRTQLGAGAHVYRQMSAPPNNPTIKQYDPNIGTTNATYGN